MINNEAKIQMLENRVNLLKTRGEQMNKGLIAKAMRQIRKIQKNG